MEQVSWQYAIIHLKHSSSYLARGGTAHGSPKMRQRGLAYIVGTRRLVPSQYRHIAVNGDRAHPLQLQ
jgi:hypothetical protein